MVLKPIGNDTLNDLTIICQNMRELDRAEIFCTARAETPEEYALQIVRFAQFGIGTVGWVAYHDDEPVAAIGVSLMWLGVASVWMFATDSFPKLSLSLTKFVKRDFIPNFTRAANIHRAQCFSMNGHSVAHAWLKVLGAKPEGVAKGYGKNGEDFTLFAWEF